MAQGDYFTPALPTNQSPFGEVVFQCCGLPTILDQQQGAWKTLGDQRAFIELVSPPNIILKHKDGRFLGEIKLTASMQYHQSSPDSFIIQTNQRVYGLRLSNSKDATTFMNTLIELHQILKSLPVQSNVSTHHSYKYQPLNHQYNDSHQNIQYGIPQNNSPPILSPVHQFQAVATQHQSVLAKQLPLASQQVQHQQYMSQQQHLRLQQQQQQLQLQQQLQQQHLRSQQQQQHLLMMQTQQQQQQQQHPSMSQKQPILHEDFTNMPIQPQNLFPSVSKGPKSPNHQSLLGVMHQNFFVDGSDDKAEPSKPPPMSEEELACDVLSESIEKGNVEKAKEMSSKLAEKNCKLTVQLLDGESIEKHKNFQIIVYVEDKVEPRGAPIFLHVDPQITTIRMLKYKVSKDYGFPVLIQRWIINDRLLKDNDSLVKCGVRNSSTAIYLYLISMEDEKQKDVEIQTEPLISPHTRQNAYDVNLSGNIFRMQSPYGGNTGMWFNGEQDLLQQQMQSGLRPQIPQIPSHNLQMQDIYSPPSFAQLPPLKVVRPRDTPVRKEGWECPGCTYKNPPTFPGCRMCSTERPEDYNAPENYQLDPEEEERLRTEEYLERLTIEAEFKRKAEEAKVAHRNFLQTMEHAKMKIIPNPDAFDCPICFTNFGVGEAVMLRECLHCFCRDCLTETIKASEDPEVRCPHNDGFPCPAVITGQEIEELLPEEEFNKFLDRSLAAAEHRTDNSFHCRSPNCIGWCIYEDEVNIFLCPACKQQNCLTCKAIHVNKTCKQYQDELKVRAENDEAAKKTQHMLQELIARGDAMNCPKCKVILQKKSGCDWMRCTMCRTEICWATKGPRWGPNNMWRSGYKFGFSGYDTKEFPPTCALVKCNEGPGDTSGGCKCNIGGKKCTPQCGNCH